jgi:hypothetical protein
MTKTLSMVSRKNYNLNAKWGFCHFLTSKLIICFIDGFTPRRKIPINCLFTQWKWTCILDFGPWNRSALDMGYVDKQPSRMPRSGQGRDRPGSGNQGSDFFGVAPAHHSDACNARHGYLESPVKTHTLSPLDIGKFNKKTHTCVCFAKYK